MLAAAHTHAQRRRAGSLAAARGAGDRERYCYTAIAGLALFAFSFWLQFDPHRYRQQDPWRERIARLHGREMRPTPQDTGVFAEVERRAAGGCHCSAYMLMLGGDKDGARCHVCSRLAGNVATATVTKCSHTKASVDIASWIHLWYMFGI